MRPATGKGQSWRSVSKAPGPPCRERGRECRGEARRAARYDVWESGCRAAEPGMCFEVLQIDADVPHGKGHWGHITRH